MMSSGVEDWRVAQAKNIPLGYAVNTNISIAEPAHILKLALDDSKSRSTCTTLLNA
jgi:hypothetical protein